jgi:hypothetical protein
MKETVASDRAEWERFRALVLQDGQLFALLRETTGLQDFADLAVLLGSQRGCVFSSERVLQAYQEARRAWLERWV